MASTSTPPRSFANDAASKKERGGVGLPQTHVGLPGSSGDTAHEGGTRGGTDGQGAAGIPEVVNTEGLPFGAALGHNTSHECRRLQSGVQLIGAVVLVAEHH